MTTILTATALDGTGFLMTDQLIRILSNDGHLRAMAASTTQLVEELRLRHATDPTATVALGRLASGTALLGSLLKGDQRLGLMIEANGPLRKLHAETDAEGFLRATIKNPLSHLPPTADKYPVADAVGKAGFLHVVKDLGLKDAYRSMVQLYTSEIAEDIAYYLTSSEQVPSSVALGVTLATDGSVAAAGGLMVQAMPGCPEELLVGLEAQLQQLPPITSLLKQGQSPLQILTDLLGAGNFAIKSDIPLAFRCRCSLRQIIAMLRALDDAEKQALATRAEATEVTCEYCHRVYRFQPEELAGLQQN
jgi:molecular chaperone Hsp33